MSVPRACVRTYRRRLHAPLRTSRASVAVREGCVFSLADAAGRVARGEAAPAYWLGAEPVAEVRALLEEVVEAIESCALSTADVENAFVHDAVEAVGNARLAGIRSKLARLPSARAAIDSACLELAALEARCGVAESLGGDARLRIPVSAIANAHNADSPAAAIARRSAQGYETVKLKAGGVEPAKEIERLRTALRACERFDLRLRIDANRAWTPSEARTILDAVAEAGAERIEFVEEPLRDPDPAASAALRAATGLPLALDESLVDVQAVLRYAECGAMDVAVAKLARLGGPRACLEAARIAARFEVRTAFTDSIETEVGVGAVAHTACVAAAGCGYAPLSLGLGGPALLAGDEDGPQGDAPIFIAPAGPGFDVETECAAP